MERPAPVFKRSRRNSIPAMTAGKIQKTCQPLIGRCGARIAVSRWPRNWLGSSADIAFLAIGRRDLATERLTNIYHKAADCFFC
jgi:hypothetical protein